jgi:hypothetical protein
MSSDAIRYVIKNGDGRYGCEFYGRSKIRFGPFNPPITTLYQTYGEPKNVIAELIKQGLYKEGDLKIVKFGEIEGDEA